MRLFGTEPLKLNHHTAMFGRHRDCQWSYNGFNVSRYHGGNCDQRVM